MAQNALIQRKLDSETYFQRQEVKINEVADALADQFAEPFAQMLKDQTVSNDWVLGAFWAKNATEGQMANRPELRAFAAFEAIRDVSMHPRVLTRLEDISRYHAFKSKQKRVKVLKISAAVLVSVAILAAFVAMIAATAQKQLQQLPQ